MQGFKYVAWISRIVSEMSLRTRSHVSEYVWIRNFFFPDSKISMSRRIRINIGFALPHVSDTYPDSLYYPGLLWEYWQQSMRRSARGICTLLCLERTWERSWHLNYRIHGKELSSILLRHRITKYPDLASTRFRFHGSLKFIRLLRVVFSSQQRLNRPAVNAVQWRHSLPENLVVILIGWLSKHSHNYV